ncbi:MAG: formylglycine-generating enzyme family protein [Treponema sp.]|nr:formylglycine-generating enzyme family protein [Treponema sp.]
MIRSAGKKRGYWIIFSLVIGLVPGGCDKSASRNTSYLFTTPAQYREMVTINGNTVTGSGSKGVFISGNTITLTSYKIAKYETTWELWDEVATWARSHGYTFTLDAGYQGHQVAGAFPELGTTDESHGWTPDQKKTRPVTFISWHDTIVWCNAYSETSGLEPVYIASDGKTILKNASDGIACDEARMKSGANGYRLPTEAQWEYAARGGNPNDTTNWNYIYAGINDIGTGNQQLGEYAWYNSNSYDLGGDNKDYGVHPVGTKAANGAGLYDMSGNVWEWCWNSYDTNVITDSGTDPAGPGTGAFRVVRGGNWSFSASFCGVTYRYYNYPYGKLPGIGFRVVCP